MVGNSHFFHRGGMIEKGRGLLIGCRFVIWVLVRCFGVGWLTKVSPGWASPKGSPGLPRLTLGPGQGELGTNFC